MHPPKTDEVALSPIAWLPRTGAFALPAVSAPAIGGLFIIIAGLAAALLLGQNGQTLIVVAAAVCGAYMALNIGANDVANNMGPAVGAGALSMGGAIAIAAVFESAGALIAGGDVV